MNKTDKFFDFIFKERPKTNLSFYVGMWVFALITLIHPVIKIIGGEGHDASEPLCAVALIATMVSVGGYVFTGKSRRSLWPLIVYAATILVVGFVGLVIIIKVSV